MVDEEAEPLRKDEDGVFESVSERAADEEDKMDEEDKDEDEEEHHVRFIGASPNIKKESLKNSSSPTHSQFPLSR